MLEEEYILRQRQYKVIQSSLITYTSLSLSMTNSLKDLPLSTVTGPMSPASGSSDFRVGARLPARASSRKEVMEAAFIVPVKGYLCRCRFLKK